MFPLAPGRLSMTTATLSLSESFCPIVRARMSMPVPGVYGTMMRMGRLGYACCAVDCVADANASSKATASQAELRDSSCIAVTLRCAQLESRDDARHGAARCQIDRRR